MGFRNDVQSRVFRGWSWSLDRPEWCITPFRHEAHASPCLTCTPARPPPPPQPALNPPSKSRKMLGDSKERIWNAKLRMQSVEWKSPNAAQQSPPKARQMAQNTPQVASNPHAEPGNSAKAGPALLLLLFCCANITRTEGQGPRFLRLPPRMS